MSYKKWISREEEASFPQFNGYKEAIEFFREKYGDQFKLLNVTTFDGQKLFFCAYIVDPEKFDKMNNYIRERDSGLIDSSDPETEGFIESYQSIEIMEDGSLHIVH